MSSWLLTIAGATPLAGALLIAAVPAFQGTRARAVALATSLLTLAVVLVIGLQFDVAKAGEYQFSQRVSWIPSFGVSYAVGVDGIALVMVALSAVLVPVCVLAAWNEVPTRTGPPRSSRSPWCSRPS